MHDMQLFLPTIDAPTMADLGTMFMHWVLCDCAEREGYNCKKCKKRCVKILNNYISPPL